MNKTKKKKFFGRIACKECGKYFKPKKDIHYLCLDCYNDREDYWECENCGKEFDYKEDCLKHEKKCKKNKYKDNNGYSRGKINHSDLIHRQIAYNFIYLKYPQFFPMPFSKYEVHHKDGDKDNNDISNLQIVTKEEHRYIHDQKRSFIK